MHVFIGTTHLLWDICPLFGDILLGGIGRNSGQREEVGGVNQGQRRHNETWKESDIQNESKVKSHMAKHRLIKAR